MRRASPPPIGRIQSCAPLWRVDTNASVRPSGDQRGWRSEPGPAVSSRACPVVTSASQTRETPRLSGSEAAVTVEATHLPSGGSCGSAPPPRPGRPGPPHSALSVRAAKPIHRGRSLAGGVEHRGLPGGCRATQAPPQDVGQVPHPAHGLVLRPRDREIHASLALAVRGRNLLPAPPSRKESSMPRTEVIATGFHVPERVVSNDELSGMMDTSDAWITQRSGIKTRHWIAPGETCSGLAHQATLNALARARLKPTDLDCIVFCTASPDHFFPGNGVSLHRHLRLAGLPPRDVRDQCSGFVYGLSASVAWIRTRPYPRA